MVYKNISNCTKKFYGVSFQPGDIKEVPGYVNDKLMVVAELPKKESKPAPKQSTKKSHLDEADTAVEVVETESQIIKEEEN